MSLGVFVKQHGLRLQRNGAALHSAPGPPEVGGSAEANIGPQAPGNEMHPPAPRPAEVQGEKRSLLVQAAAAKKGRPEESESERLMKEEQELLRNITRQKALKGVKELAKVSFCALNQQRISSFRPQSPKIGPAFQA